MPSRWRDDAWHRIDQTPNLDWMILSKRPENALKMLPTLAIGAPAWGDGWPNVWVGATVEDVARKRRIDVLREIPARVRFLSIEPLLEDLGVLDLRGIHLVIVGGESGPRPMHPSWVRKIREQCAAAGVAFFFKQWSDWLIGERTRQSEDGNPFGLPLRFQNGDEFDINSDGEDILFGAALDEEAGPTAIWRRFGGWKGHLVLKVGSKRAGRLLDGITHDAMPEPRP